MIIIEDRRTGLPLRVDDREISEILQAWGKRLVVKRLIVEGDHYAEVKGRLLCGKPIHWVLRLVDGRIGREEAKRISEEIRKMYEVDDEGDDDEDVPT